MKAEIEVLQPGLYTSIQDLGRFGFQKFGVPQSGVMDRYAMRICNLILGNLQEAAVMEISMQGPKLKFNTPTSVCISGADLSPKLNGEAIPNNEIIAVEEDDIIEFGMRKSGFRSYLGISGGFDTEKIMDSLSWYEGITEQFRLEKGMKLPYSRESFTDAETYSSLKIDAEYIKSSEIEVYPGPEFEFLTEDQKNKLFDLDFKTDENSNRMAVQLKEELKNELDSIITSPVLPGTVQLTPSGKIIVLMRDSQTTGGYPRILQLSEYGIQVLSQKLPGENIKFLKKNYPEI